MDRTGQIALPDIWAPEDCGVLACPCCGWWEFEHPFAEGHFISWPQEMMSYVKCKFCGDITFVANLVKLEWIPISGRPSEKEVKDGLRKSNSTMKEERGTE